MRWRPRADGRPLPRALLRLSSPIPNAQPAGGGNFQQTSAPPRSARTDEDGQYEFAELPAATYTLVAAKSGFMSLEFGQRRALERGLSIKLGDGETREHVDIVLQRPSAIAGRIVDEAGDPVEGASVRVLQIRFLAGRRRQVEVGVASRPTTDQGRYRIYGLQPGQYVVGAVVGQILVNQPPGDLPGYAPTYFPGTPNPAEAQTVTVGLSQDALSVDFAIVPLRTARIAGVAGPRPRG